MSESYNSENTHLLALLFGCFRYRLKGERWKCHGRGLWKASSIKLVILWKYSPGMEIMQGALCLLPKGTLILMFIYVEDRRNGEFSSVASAFQFLHAALKCSSSFSQKSGWWRTSRTRWLISSFDFAKLPVFCYSITSLIELVLYGEETTILCCLGTLVESAASEVFRWYRSSGEINVSGSCEGRYW